MPYMTRIPSDLARFGLKVELLPGWQTRGSDSFAPACVVAHWTAGPRGSSSRPSLNVVTNGRPGLSGPLCNVYLDRRGVCVVVAAGRANHAGLGGFRGLVGNSAAYGIEAESGGDGDWTDEQLRAYPRLLAALISGLGRDASWTTDHSTWAPDRKIDVRDIKAFLRAQTAVVLAAGPGPAHSEEDELMAAKDEIIAALRPTLFQKAYRNDPDRGGNGAVAMTSPGYWVGVSSTSYLKLYVARAICPDPLTVPPNEWREFQRVALSSAPALDPQAIVAALLAALPDQDPAAVADALAPTLARALLDGGLDVSGGASPDDIAAALRRVLVEGVGDNAA